MDVSVKMIHLAQDWFQWLAGFGISGVEGFTSRYSPNRTIKYNTTIKVFNLNTIFASSIYHIVAVIT